MVAFARRGGIECVGEGQLAWKRGRTSSQVCLLWSAHRQSLFTTTLNINVHVNVHVKLWKQAQRPTLIPTVCLSLSPCSGRRLRVRPWGESGTRNAAEILASPKLFRSKIPPASRNTVNIPRLRISKSTPSPVEASTTSTIATSDNCRGPAIPSGTPSFVA